MTISLPPKTSVAALHAANLFTSTSHPIWPKEVDAPECWGPALRIISEAIKQPVPKLTAPPPVPDLRPRAYENVVLFSGGKDSLAVACKLKDSNRPVALMIAPRVNRSMSDEHRVAKALASMGGFGELLEANIKIDGKVANFIENPFKNAILMAMASEQGNNIFLGNNQVHTLETVAVETELNDSLEFTDAVLQALRAYYSKLGNECLLHCPWDAWGTLWTQHADLGNLARGCELPAYRRPMVLRRAQAKGCNLDSGHCGKCYKCQLNILSRIVFGLQPNNQYVEEVWKHAALDTLKRYPDAIVTPESLWEENICPACVAKYNGNVDLLEKPTQKTVDVALEEVSKSEKKKRVARKRLAATVLKPLAPLEWKTESRRVGDLMKFPNNPRKMTEEQRERLKESLQRFNLVELPAITPHNTILAGNQRVAMLVLLGRSDDMIDVRVPNRELTEEEQREYVVRSNLNTGEWDWSLLEEFWAKEDLLAWGWPKMDMLSGTDTVQQKATVDLGKLRRLFGAPPFSVLDARAGEWKSRKLEWFSIGIKPEEGRDAEVNVGRVYASNLAEAKYRRGNAKRVSGNQIGTSRFDPVLAELCMRWWCPPKGAVLDPFGGESTKGIVAGVLGHDYLGIELRKEQVETNREQCRGIKGLLRTPQWVVGDSLAKESYPADEFDMVFTSPPYFDLEEYHGGEKDGSGLNRYGDFVKWLENILRLCAERLRENRHIVIKIGDVRSKTNGVLRGLHHDLNAAVNRLGLHTFDDAIYVTPVGTMALRTSFHWPRTHTLGRGHQYVMVFWKGNPKERPRIMRTWAAQLEMEQQAAA